MDGNISEALSQDETIPCRLVYQAFSHSDKKLTKYYDFFNKDI